MRVTWLRGARTHAPAGRVNEALRRVLIQRGDSVLHRVEHAGALAQNQSAVFGLAARDQGARGLEPCKPGLVIPQHTVRHRSCVACTGVD